MRELTAVEQLRIRIAKLDGYWIREGWSEVHNCPCWTLYKGSQRYGKSNTMIEPWGNAPKFATSIDDLDDFCARHGIVWVKDVDGVEVWLGKDSRRVSVFRDSAGREQVALALAKGVESVMAMQGR